MAYRFGIIPVDQIAEINKQEKSLDSLRRNASDKPAAGISELFDMLSDSGAGEFVVECSAGARGAIIAVEEFESDFLESLLELTMGREFAVYDEQIERLYDPCGRVEIQVDIANVVTLPYLSRTLLGDLVRHLTWPSPDCPFIVIAREGQEKFIQVCDDDGSCQLEYRDGGPEAHFVFHTSDRELVSDVMWAWTTQDERWRDAVAWTFLDLSEEDEELPE